jgi:osmotically-inducible protein OsmY
MKKSYIVIRFLVVLMMIAAFVACATTPKQEGPGAYVDDSVITTKIKSLLAADDFLKSFEITVETYKGTVQLSGFVNSQQAVDKAGQIASSVKGVQSVKNNLMVK